MLRNKDEGGWDKTINEDEWRKKIYDALVLDNAQDFEFENLLELIIETIYNITAGNMENQGFAVKNIQILQKFVSVSLFNSR